MHVVHPALKPATVEFRGYQANLARIAGREDTLVVLPTGMGKTVVALLAIADALQAGAQRVLLLAPTRPLVEQHAEFLAAVLAPPWSERVHALTGTQAPERRAAAYAQPGLVVATPQVVHNDIVGGRLAVDTFDWVVFDEAHRATGDYPYAFIGQELQRKASKARRLGLTASPGHDVRKIEEVRTNLGLSRAEIRTPQDADVAPFVQDVKIEWETLPLPPVMARVSAKLHDAFAERVRALKGQGFLKTAGSRPSRRQLLEMAGIVQNKISQSSNPDATLYTALSLQAQAIKVLHAIEQVETQGAASLVGYLENLRADAQAPKASKATRNLAEDPRLNEAYHIARHDDSENPKLGRTGTLVREQLEKDPGSRIIVFTHYRTTCEVVAEHLQRLPGVKAVVFVGQGKSGGQSGMSQREQAETLERFRKGEINTLVATSVAEEGLDIPQTDLVVFFEPISSEIRSIQRRGRTGRNREGRVVVLMTKGTQDEAAHWSAKRKEQEMVRELHGLRGALAQPAARQGQQTLGSALGASHAPLPTTPLAAPLPSTPRPAILPTASMPAATAPGPAPASQGSSPGHPGATLAQRPPDATPGGGPRIVFDAREQSGAVVRHLHEMGAQLEGRTLQVGDFVVSDRIAVERKTHADFIDSLVDGRLFEQMRQLKEYPRPFVVLEGDGLHGHRNVGPEAIHAAVASIVVDYGIPVLQTRDGLETARFLLAVAKREQGRESRKIALRPARPADPEQQRRVLVAGLPGVSDVLAGRLLDAFGSAEGAFTAPASELAKVEGIGPAKAAEMRRVLTSGRNGVPTTETP